MFSKTLMQNCPTLVQSRCSMIFVGLVCSFKKSVPATPGKPRGAWCGKPVALPRILKMILVDYRNSNKPRKDDGTHEIYFRKMDICKPHFWILLILFELSHSPIHQLSLLLFVRVLRGHSGSRFWKRWWTRWSLDVIGYGTIFCATIATGMLFILRMVNCGSQGLQWSSNLTPTQFEKALTSS